MRQRPETGAAPTSPGPSWLEPGFKGLHVHTIGKCEPNSPDPTDPADIGNFLSADGHLKAPGESHAGHDGDLSSLMVRSDGSAELVVGTDSLPLDALLDADGSAVIVRSRRVRLVEAA